MRSWVAVFLVAGGLAAGEHAVLTNGGRLHGERHETIDGKVRLYTGQTGFIELDAGLVERIDVDAAPDPPPAPPAPVVDTVPAPVPLDARQLADQAADRYGLPRSLVRSVVKAESAFQPHVVSPKGAIGLMQLMPGTAAELGANPHDPAQNVDAGTRYLRDLLIRYDGGLFHALAAYNAGPRAVEKYNGVPPYRETVGYINRVVKDSGLNSRKSEPAGRASGE
jgi:hypothetical protein